MYLKEGWFLIRESAAINLGTEWGGGGAFFGFSSLIPQVEIIPPPPKKKKKKRIHHRKMNKFLLSTLTVHSWVLH